jgi:CDP-diacylglycerol--glycerol-3-phosphate 3-phosphatidyltransferase
VRLTNPQRFDSLSDRLRYLARPLLAVLGERLHRLGVHPNDLTLAGLTLTGVSGLLTALGRFRAAGWLLLLGAPIDALDGAVARAMKRRDRFGALFDSTLDRYAEGFLLLGLSVHFARAGSVFKVGLCAASMIGSFMVSYVRARAEGLGLPSIKSGLFSRLERMLLWLVMQFTGRVEAGIWIMALLTNFTALQRLVAARRLMREPASAPNPTFPNEEDSTSNG